MRTTALTALAAAGMLAACGPKPIAFVGVDHPKATGLLTPDVALHYAKDPAPEGASVIEHLSQTERSTNCENATINALEKMQKAAVEKGGNALVNLKAVWEGAEVSNTEGFWCVKSKGMAMVAGPFVSMYGITWEGDVATIGAAAPPVEPVGAPAEESAE